jgi:hypothetical protein
MSAKLNEPIAEALYAAVEVLEGLQLPYALVGGLAVQAHARPRWSQDVDLVLDPRQKRPSDIRRAMEKGGFRATHGRPVKLPGVVLLQFSWPGRRLLLDIRVDLLLGLEEFQKGVAARAESLPMGTREVRLVRAEDLLLLKLLAPRPVDYVDAVDLIRGNMGRLDEGYLNEWSKRLGVARQYHRALREAGTPRT